MRYQNLHPSDQQLLQLSDGELRRSHATQVQAHLAACWECRARMANLQRAIVDFVGVHRQSLDSQLPPPAGARALLKAQMAEAAQNLPTKSWWSFGFPNYVRRFVYAALLLLITGVGGSFLYRHLTAGSAVAYAGLLPDRSLTPGATRAVNLRDVCAEDHDDVVRTVPASLETKVFQEYGLNNVREQNYEVDYLISPGLGGSDDIRNLWPEPRYDATWNSFVKDQLEDYLHASVCNGKIGLDTAQKDVASDWIAAYKKYFHTDQPRPAYSAAASSSEKSTNF
jgi:hypothetical protein